MKCLSLHSADITQNGIGHKSHIFGFGSKIGRSIKNVRTSSSFMLAIKKIVYFICEANLSYHHILVIDIII